MADFENYAGDPDNYPANVRLPTGSAPSNSTDLAPPLEDLSDRTANLASGIRKIRRVASTSVMAALTGLDQYEICLVAPVAYWLYYSPEVTPLSDGVVTSTGMSGYYWIPLNPNRLISNGYEVAALGIIGECTSAADWTVVVFADLTYQQGDHIEVDTGPLVASCATLPGVLAVGFSEDAGATWGDVYAQVPVANAGAVPYSLSAVHIIAGSGGTVRVAILGKASSGAHTFVYGWGPEGKHWGRVKVWRP